MTEQPELMAKDIAQIISEEIGGAWEMYEAASKRILSALPPQPPVTPMDLEAAAKIIYERGMRYLRLDVPEWVDGGNSLAQDEARAIATAIAGGDA